MTVSVIVTRGDGTVYGPDIIDPLMATTSVALERGRNELDANGTDTKTVELQTVYRPSVRPGQTLEVHDTVQGVPWRGKITSVRHISNLSGLFTKLSVVRVA